MKTRVSRRTFMNRAAGAAGMAVAGRTILLDAVSSSSAGIWLAASGRPAEGDKVRFGMIGIGMQGSGLLATAITLPEVECVAACDLYDGRHQLAKEIVGSQSLVTTRHYQELLDSKNVDCLIAAVPDHWHKQIIVDACNHGKDIYCEKPMTHKVEEGFEIIEAEHKNNRIVQIGSQRRSSIVFAKAKELIAQGAIGDVCLVEGSMGRNDSCGAWVYPPPPDLSPQTLDWETWLGNAPSRPFDPIRFARWRGFQDYGEGVPGDLYVHVLTGIHYVMGVSAPPARALSTGGLFRWKDDGRDQPDCLTTLYDYPSFRATIRVTLNTEAPEVTRFMGMRGVLEIHGSGVTVSPQDGQDHGPCYYTNSYPHALHAEYVKGWEDAHELKPGAAKTIESVTYRAPESYNEDRDHLWNYFQSVRMRQPSVEDGTFGNNTAIACHMANDSYFNKRVAEWDAAGKRIAKG